MKNITVSVDEEVYHRARVRAAEKKTSVSAWVGRILRDLADKETDFERSRRREEETVAAVRECGAKYRAGDRLTRDELHDRHALR